MDVQVSSMRVIRPCEIPNISLRSSVSSKKIYILGEFPGGIPRDLDAGFLCSLNRFAQGSVKPGCVTVYRE